ncbi:MAG: MBL fold metallo-hydrolase [Nocardioides sp.]
MTVRPELGAHITLGVGGRATLDLINSPAASEDAYVGMLRACGALDLAEQWRDFTARSTPDLSHWEYPDTWLEDDQVIEVGSRRLEAIATPGHPGPRRLRRHRRRAALRRRPRAADHHAVDRVRARAAAPAARRPGLPDQGARPRRPAAPARPRPPTSPACCPVPATSTTSPTDVFDAAPATLETRAHLELLVAQGLLTGTEDGDGAVRYSPAGRSIGA